jgi:hypothetical protein
MKYLFLLGAHLLCTPLYAQPWNFTSSGNTNLTSGTLNNFNNLHKVTLGPNSYQVSGSAILDVKPNKLIHLQPGFQVTGLTTGNAHLHIYDKVMPVAAFPAVYSNIPKYSRFEVGIVLPAAIQQQIDNFFDPNYSGSNAINPYNQNAIQVTCTYKNSNGNIYTRYGFYYREYTVVPPPASNLSKMWVEVPTDYKFRIRFAPPETGLFLGIISVAVNNSTTPYIAEFEFSVAQSSNLGHLDMSTTPGNLKMEYPNGTKFFGVGRNIPWANNHIYTYPTTPANTYCLATSADWIEEPSSPETHDDHRAIISDFGNNGGNLARIRLDNWSVPIETIDIRIMDTVQQKNDLGKSLNNYDNNQYFMWEMDRTLGVCEQKDIKIMLSILCNTSFYINGFWPRNPYSTLLGTSMSDRNKFFTDTTAKEIFRRRLFYILNRWGYSTSIGMWQLINETENIEGYDTIPFPTLPQDIGKWVCEMRTYLRALYPSHPVTNGTTRVTNDMYLGGNTKYANNFVNCLDIYSSNNYAPEWDITNQQHFSLINDAFDAAENRHTKFWKTTNGSKPFIWAEMGLGNDPLYGIDGLSVYNFHNTLWSSIFTNNVSTAMMFHSWQDPCPASTLPNPKHVHFNAMRCFADNIIFSLPLLPDRNINSPIWAPNNFPPHFRPPYSITESQTSPTLTYWMRTHGKSLVYGWSRNTSANWTTDGYLSGCLPPNHKNIVDSLFGNCSPQPCAKVVTPSAFTTVNWMIVQGLVPNACYNVEIFDTWTVPFHMNLQNNLLETKTAVITDNVGTLAFSRPMPTYAYSTSNGQTYYPDYAFIATRCEGIGEGEGGGGRLSKGTDETVIQTLADGTWSGYEGVFPVPAENTVRLSLIKSDWKNPKVTINDELGRSIEKQVEYDGHIDIAELPNGVYLLKVADKSHEKYFKLIIAR